jgi:predicted O-methyltransferase YrrM
MNTIDLPAPPRAAAMPTGIAAASSQEFDFTNTWFAEAAKNVWDMLIPQIKPRRILEVGSYEGASACYMILKCAIEAPIEIHCVDTWEGGVEHKAGGVEMQGVEARFFHNTRLARESVRNPVDLVVHKGYSQFCLAELLARTRGNYFDLVYIDGSHQAPDVLTDAVLGFQLLAPGGVMIFDDYLWAENLPYGRDPLRCPKPAIDAFININFRKLQILQAPLYQIYLRKLCA